VIEKAYPGSCVVNQRGNRIANESQNFIEFQLQLYAKHSESDPQVPTWMVFDARFRRTYLVGPLYKARLRPDWMLPRVYFSSGFLSRACSIQELAQRAGIEPVGLSKTIALMNEYAKSGKDLEFGRGDADADRYFSDPTVKPNPCLAPIIEPPYYAVRIEPGDVGTHGGLVTDTHARVLRQNGDPIPGLYATGNCAAPVLPTYPAAGSTLGPAMTFGWRAAQHIADAKENAP
jgi:3-oxosteroid 1-dehydrogenase